MIDLEQRDFRLGLLQMDLKLKPDLYQHQYDHNQSYEENLRNAVSSFLREQLEDEMGNTVGVGVCVPGPYYQQGDRVLHSRIPELSSAKLKATLCPFFSDQILYIDEDVRCAAQLNGSLTLQDDHIFYALISEGVSGAIFIMAKFLTAPIPARVRLAECIRKAAK